MIVPPPDCNACYREEILKGALACHTGMATFAQAGVSEKASG